MASVTWKAFAAVLMAAFVVTAWCAEGMLGGAKANASPSVPAAQTDRPKVDDFEGLETLSNGKKGLKSKKSTASTMSLKGENLFIRSVVIARSSKGVWVGEITEDNTEGKESTADIVCKAHKANRKHVPGQTKKPEDTHETEMVTVTVTNDSGGTSDPKEKDVETNTK